MPDHAEQLASNASPELTPTQPGVEVAGLERNHLSVGRALLTGLVQLQIGPSIALVGGALFVTSGTASWLSIVLAIGLLMCIAEAVRVLARRFVASGGIMSYVLASCGYRSGLAVGAGLVLGYIATVAALVSTTVLFTSGALADLGVQDPDAVWIQVVATIVIGGLSTVVACLGLDAAVKVTTILGLVCLPLVVWISVAATAHTGFNLSDQMHLGDTSVDLVRAGALLILANLIGFDDLATLAAETKNPKRSIPRILSGVLIISGIAYVVATVTQMGALQSNAAALQGGSSPVAILAEAGHVGYLATATDILLVFACFASCVTSLIFGARMFATAASVGILPKPLMKVSRRHSPYLAVIVLGTAQIVLPVLLAAATGKTPLDAAIYFSKAIAYLWAPAYVLTCIGAALVLKRQRLLTPFSILVLAVGGVGSGWYLIDGMSHGFASVDDALPWICILAAGIVFALFLVAGRNTPPESRNAALARLDS